MVPIMPFFKCGFFLLVVVALLYYVLTACHICIQNNILNNKIFCLHCLQTLFGKVAGGGTLAVAVSVTDMRHVTRTICPGIPNNLFWGMGGLFSFIIIDFLYWCYYPHALKDLKSEKNQGGKIGIQRMIIFRTSSFSYTCSFI